jgi:outer membrane protein insertion porin family
VSIEKNLPRAAAWAAALSFLVLVPAAPLPAQAPAGQPQEAAVRVDTVIVRGQVRQPEAVIRAEAGIQAGDRITHREIQRAIRRLWASGQFQDVKVYAQGSPEEPGSPVAVILEVTEQPYVAEIDFRGLQNVKAGMVRDTVGLRAGAPLRPGKVAEAEALIRSELSRKGFQVRRLEHRLEELPGRPGEHRLVFDVEEGQRVAIAEVAFEGNTVFGADRLRSAMTLKPEGFFWFRAGTFDEEQLRVDLRESLPAFYAQHGYLDFAVLGDSLVVDPHTGKARLVIQLAEGEQYRLADFEVRGNSRFPAQELERFFEQESRGLLGGFGLGRGGGAVEDGAVFDLVAFEGATARINQLYQNEGYLYARVEPIIERTTLADGRPAVSAAWEIQENEPAYVRRVSIEGNTFTHEQVIRERIFLLPGDVYSQQLLLESYKSISGLGFFEAPMPMPRIEPDPETGDVNITFEVKEKQTGSINFGTAIGGGTGLAGFLGYDQPNLFGQAKSGHLRWEFGRWQNNFEMRYADPAVLQSRVSGSVSLFSTRDRFFTFQEGQRVRTGAGFRFGVPVPNDRYSRLMLGYSLARTTYQQFDDGGSSVFGLPPGLQSTASVGLARNTLDHPLFPTAGTRAELDASLSGGVLGGDGNFQKYSALGTWWVPVGEVGGGQPGARPVRFSLGLSAEVGTLFGDAERFPFERYWMGGVQFGRPLRGYDETTITPRGYFRRGAPGIGLEDRFGDAYLRLSAEYAVRFNDNISVSAFYDAGNIWRAPSQINPMRLARGAGLGVMLMTPFGPLGLDYAYGFDKDVPGWQLHFKMGGM